MTDEEGPQGAEPNAGRQLFEQLQHTSDETLTRKVSDVEGLRQEIEGKKAIDDYAAGRELKRIRTYAIWGLFGVISVAVLALLLALLALFARYIFELYHSPSNAIAFMRNVLEWVLVVMATLFVERSFGRRQD